MLIAVATLSLADAPAAADAKLEPRAVAELMMSAIELPGWTLAEPPRVAAGQDLFELIDGGAEIYQEYGFKRVESRRYERGAASLQIELYQMADVSAAYGIYSMMQSPRGTPVDVGQEARLFRDYLMFWQGDFYASLTLTGEDANAAQALTEAARTIAARITTVGERPAIMRWLPEAGLQDGKYLRGPIALSNVYVFGAGDAFGAIEAACGVYADRREFIFSYPRDEAASARLAGVREAMMNDGAYRGFAQTPEGFECRDADGRRIVAGRDGSRLLVRVQETAIEAGR
ncbi:DUF6599 family protein [Opitutus terrae]|uniref:DUF6599 family protein n=1 Tax=Opitutus terrae TaxID=107709 RepID=UPI0002E20B81|nr:DUF6599 family protein [Opitutus terrae]